MSTKITTIYDNLVTKLSTVLPAYVRIPNPYSPEENPELFLRKGYGIGIGTGENTRRLICGFFSINRTFNIILINQILTTDTNSNVRGSFERDLMEDHYTIVNALEVDNNLSGAAVKTIFSADSGIQFVEGEMGKYVMCEITFEVEYLEPIS